MSSINIKELFDREEASLVLQKDGSIIYSDYGRGIGPAVKLLVSHSDLLKNACVFDVIIGKAAAALFVLGGAAEVHGWTMSDAGFEMLESHGIKASREIPTDVILNRTLTGLCPFEEAVIDCSSPEACREAVFKKMQDMGISI